MVKCRVCGKKLNQDNWYGFHRKRSDNNCKRYICKSCMNQKNRKSRKRNYVPHRFEKERICRECGKEFLAKSANQLTCSEKCKKTYWNKYSAKWKKMKRDKNPEVRKKENQRSKDYYWKNKDRILIRERKRHKEKREKLRKLAKQIIGDRCIICNRIPRKILFHEIHSKKHQSGYHFILQHPEDFVPMCTSCHRGLHVYYKYKLKMEKMEQLMR